MTRLLLVTAVEAEADALRAAGAPGVTIVAVGAGPAAAAAGTARLLATGTYGGVLSAGIAGGFTGRAGLGDLVIGTRSIAADLGAETPDGFLPIEELGFGSSAFDADPALVQAWREAIPAAVTGAILTLATVTGTATTAATLEARYPDAVAEAMEGFGVATAAAAAGVPFAELRAISNVIGPRDRSAWRLGEAFAVMKRALTMWADRQSAVRVPGPDSR
jgi:futalosine hydrolase